LFSLALFRNSRTLDEALRARALDDAPLAGARFARARTVDVSFAPAETDFVDFFVDLLRAAIFKLSTHNSTPHF
jgi:hypothetical protein